MGNWYDEYRHTNRLMTINGKRGTYAVYEFETEEQVENFLEEVGGAPIGFNRVVLFVE